MKKEKATRARLGDKPEQSLTDWERIDALTEDDLERAIDEDPDTMRLEDMDLSSAVLYRPGKSKERVYPP